MSASTQSTISALLAAATLMTLCLSGCERKKKVIDIKTPAGSLEVEQDQKTGEVEIEVSEKEQ